MYVYLRTSVCMFAWLFAYVSGLGKPIHDLQKPEILDKICVWKDTHKCLSLSSLHLSLKTIYEGLALPMQDGTKAPFESIIPPIINT